MFNLFRNLSLVLLAIFFFTACSKRETISPVQINSFYKPTANNQIKNSKAMHRATLRSYTVFGKRYYPKVVSLGHVHRGIASWYGPKFHAKKTSNGEIYNMYAMTAAHKTLPMNTMVRVDNLENGNSIIVRINDRGPFIDGRIIDLSNKAAHKIDMVKKGTVKVRVTVIGFNGIVDDNNAPSSETSKRKPELKSEVKHFGNYSLQVGAFGSLDGAERTKEKYETITNEHDVIIKKVFSQGRFLHKVFIMGFNSHSQAANFRNSNGIKAFIIEE
jgi:rare lipoprotein A